MITSREIYYDYLNQDRKALGWQNISFKDRLKMIFAPDYILNFQSLLRKVEYYENSKKNIFEQVYYYFLRLKYKRLSVKLGLTIPLNVFGPGLSIVHYGTIIINMKTKVGKNCRIHACTNIGASGGTKEAPTIGDNVYIAPGAKIYGNITIANNIAIGANAVVNKSFEEEGIFIAGNPAQKIKKIDIKKIITHI
ncbi:serine O-acetyltransferase [uncultured Croceitalea sp.]|uniref:serine O-acetyltransferase n=1 Tax=uncultured Croceitalea sp. TaxID=1798908 RepID=UPI00374F807D